MSKTQDAYLSERLAQSKIVHLLQTAQSVRKVSQNAFARSLGLKSPELSGYYRGTRKLSGKKLLTILEHGSRSRIFSSEQLSQLQEQLNVLAPPEWSKTKPVARIQREQFEQIAEWYHAAIHALISSQPSLLNQPAEVARQLGLSPEIVKGAVRRIEVSNISWDRSRLRYVYAENVRVAELTAQNRIMTRKALDALELIPPDRRHFGWVTIEAGQEQLSLIKNLVDTFHQQIMKILMDATNSDGVDRAKEVFHLQTHFFSLSELARRSRGAA